MFIDFFSKISGDLAVILAMAGIALALGFVFGRFKLVNILINIYIAFAATIVLPDAVADLFKYAEVFFFVVFIAVLTLLGDYLFDIHISGSGRGFFSRLIAMSFLIVILFFSLASFFIPKKEMLEIISPNMYNYLASPSARFFWFALPIGLVSYLNRKSRR